MDSKELHKVGTESELVLGTSAHVIRMTAME